LKSKLSAIRSEYIRGKLDSGEVDSDPFVQFRVWMEEALKSKVEEPTAMVLATAGKDGQPSARVVLLKDFNNQGFSFFTNYHSRKGLELGENPKAALTFFWKEMERQVRIEGEVITVEPDISASYFASRPFESKLSAAISPQSKVIPDRLYLDKKKQSYRKKNHDQPITRPEHWGGYKLIPHRIEFWQGRENRLHDRLLYTYTGAIWEIKRLAP